MTNKSPASANWLWTNSFTGELDGKGHFSTSVARGGSKLALSGADLFYAYRGEQWTPPWGGLLQANQFMHYRTNKTFVGQFGLPRVVESLDQRPGAAGNVHTFSVVKIGGRTYLYTSDEWSHGIHRWWIK